MVQHCMNGMYITYAWSSFNHYVKYAQHSVLSGGEASLGLLHGQLLPILSFGSLLQSMIALLYLMHACPWLCQQHSQHACMHDHILLITFKTYEDMLSQGGEYNSYRAIFCHNHVHMCMDLMANIKFQFMNSASYKLNIRSNMFVTFFIYDLLNVHI